MTERETMNIFNGTLQRLYEWLRQQKLYLLVYTVLATIFVIIANVYINAEIDDSYDEIQNEINYGIFENKKSFGIRNEIYTIVSYSKAEVPSLTDKNDSSSYQQQYGGIRTYYRASSGWTITVFKKTGKTIVESSIKPYAVGLKPSSNSSPDSYFSRLYNNIANDEDYNVNINNEFKVSKLQNLSSKFHVIEVRLIGIDDGLMWYDFYDGKAYSQIMQERWYNICDNQTKIDIYRALYNSAALIIATLLYWMIIKVYKRKPRSYKNKFNLDISLNKSSEIKENSEIDVNDLLSKINPSNFMSPYDPEKVKIANDLYSALIKSKDNETIVSLIREKAMSELNIK